jgi:HAD superfamily hydrolase (TIGR01509 family)
MTVTPAGCLFDLDGLLLDTEPLHGRAWRQAARVFGAELSDEQVLSLRGRRRQDCARQVREWLPGPVSSDRLLAVQQPIVRGLLPQAPPLDGAEALLEACRDRGIPMALVTSSSRETAALKTAPHPWIDALLPVRVLGDDPDLAAGKPAADPYLLAAGRLGLDPGCCWAFEDSLAGARSAAAAGCRVHVLLRPDSDGLRQVLPEGCRVLASLREALGWLPQAGNN